LGNRVGYFRFGFIKYDFSLGKAEDSVGFDIGVKETTTKVSYLGLEILENFKKFKKLEGKTKIEK